MQFIHSYDKINNVEETHAGVSEWQTRQTQNLLWATTCGFKSRCRQYKIYAEALVKSRASAFFAFHGSNYFQSSPDFFSFYTKPFYHYPVKLFVYGNVFPYHLLNVHRHHTIFVIQKELFPKILVYILVSFVSAYY